MYSVSLGKTQFAISCVMCFLMDSGPNTDSLGKTQFATSCVMCFPMDSGPNTDSLGKTVFSYGFGPKHRFPWKNPNPKHVDRKPFVSPSVLCGLLVVSSSHPCLVVSRLVMSPRPKCFGPCLACFWLKPHLPTPT